MRRTLMVVNLCLASSAVILSILNWMEIDKINEAVESLERRLDALAATTISLQREVHDEAFDYPFNE